MDDDIITHFARKRVNNEYDCGSSDEEGDYVNSYELRLRHEVAGTAVKRKRNYNVHRPIFIPDQETRRDVRRIRFARDVERYSIYSLSDEASLLEEGAISETYSDEDESANANVRNPRRTNANARATTTMRVTVAANGNRFSRRPTVAFDPRPSQVYS